MRGIFAVNQREDGGDLYGRIGGFLVDHALSPEPSHYSFAYAVLVDPEGPVAQAVGRLTDGGIRLSSRDIESLGGRVVAGSAAQSQRAVAQRAEDGAAKLVAETHAKVDGFAAMMRSIHDETRGFGRDLEQSAAAMTATSANGGIDEIARLTGAMLSRVRDAETRLARATDEAESLRVKLAEANDTARRDPLTGLANRRAFEEAYAARDPSAGPYCLAVCDVDRFKRINDAHGHAVGDRVLSAVGKTLLEECGEHLVTRHGGEEFAILMSGIELAAAAELLDAVRATVASKRFRTRDTDRPLGQITLSIGVTAIHADEPSGEGLNRADRLLYMAKSDGRDRVCAA